MEQRKSEDVCNFVSWTVAPALVLVLLRCCKEMHVLWLKVQTHNVSILVKSLIGK